MMGLALQKEVVEMSDPNSHVLASVPIIVGTTGALVIGPVLTEYTYIMAGGFFGALFALASTPQVGFWGNLLFLVRSIGAAIIFGSVSTVVISKYVGLDAGILLAPTSGIIAMYAHRIHDIGVDFLKQGYEIVMAKLRKSFGVPKPKSRNREDK